MSAAANPLLDHVGRLEPIGEGDRLGFACRGCGQKCCVNQEIFLTPPEFARIVWFLQRNPHLEQRLRAHNIRWAELFIGHSTGLPGMKLAFLPFADGAADQGSYCPFLSPVVRHTDGRAVPTGMHWCGLHGSRPGACRIYPLGRITRESEGRIDYVVVKRCPGFEPAPGAEPVPPGYAPPAATQTVRDWLASELLPEQEREREFFVYRVVDALITAGVHAATDDNPDGLLDDDQAIELGLRRLFQPPPAPADASTDHATLMAWMTAMVDDLVSARSPA